MQSGRWVSLDTASAFSSKCGTKRTKSGKPYLCLPKKAIDSLMRTKSGKEALRSQARRKVRAKKGARVKYNPKVKEAYQRVQKRTRFKDKKK